MRVKPKLVYTDAEPTKYTPCEAPVPATAHMYVRIVVAFKGQFCWLCDYARSGGLYCELFRKALVQRIYPEGGDPPVRCDECVSAVKRPGLFGKGIIER